MEKELSNHLKKSQANIITVVIIILVVMTGIVVLYNTVIPLLKSKGGEASLSVFIIRLDHSKKPLIIQENEEKYVVFNVKRNNAAGELIGIKFFAMDSTGNIYSYSERDINKLPKELETKEFKISYHQFNYNGLEDLIGFYFAPIIKENKKEIIGIPSTKMTIVVPPCTSDAECDDSLSCTERDVCEDGLCKYYDDDNDCGCNSDCTDRECGPDPICGRSCGNCPSEDICSDGNCVKPFEGLIAYYPFDENSDDKSGNENHGIVYNGAYLTSGKIEKAYYFDGVDDYVSAPLNEFLYGNSPRTFSIWFKLESYEHKGDNLNLIMIGNEESNDGFYIIVMANGASLCTGQWGGGDISCYEEHIELGEWYHVATTFNGIESILYVNGQKIGPTSRSFDTSKTELFIGGSSEGWERTNVVIDEVKIYNRALTQQEIDSLVNI